MKNFSDVLKELQNSKNLSIVQLSKECGLPYRTLQNYLLKLREPNLGALITLADYFDVSLDYLVGRSDNPDRF